MGTGTKPFTLWGCLLSRYRLLRAPGQAAELLIVNELRDRRRVAAGRAGWILAPAQRAHLTLEGGEEEQPARQRLANAEQHLDRLNRLQCAHEAGHRANDPTFRARWHRARRRRCREEAAGAAAARQEGRGLPLPLPGAGGKERRAHP